MARDEERLIRLKQQHSKKAIALAMQGRWQEAVDVNKEILESFPEDVDACNRLGRAYMELGQFSLSREAYGRAVELDPYNAITNRNLRRLKDLQETDGADVDEDKVEPQQFIEEIGKAGVVTLYELAPKETRARMVAGDRVYLKLDGSTLNVENSRGVYMGRVDPKYSKRLARLMLGGNQYSASVVKSTMDVMTVMIRETYQDPSQAGKLSFAPKGMEEVRPYVSDRIFAPDSEYEDDSEDESGYTIIGGDQVEVLPEESSGDDDDTGNDDE